MKLRGRLLQSCCLSLALAATFSELMPEGPARAADLTQSAQLPKTGELWSAEASRSRPDLVGMLSDGDPEVRAFAAIQLGDLPGQDSSTAALVAALRDRDERVRLRAALALSRIGDPAAVALGRALGDRSVVGVAPTLWRGSQSEHMDTKSLTVSDLAFFAVASSHFTHAGALTAAAPAAFESIGPAELDANPGSAAATPAELAWVALLSQDEVSSNVVEEALQAAQGVVATPLDQASRDRIARKALEAVAGIDEPSATLIARLGEIAGSSPIGRYAVVSLAKLGEPAAPTLGALMNIRSDDARAAWARVVRLDMPGAAAEFARMVALEKSPTVLNAILWRVRHDRMRSKGEPQMGRQGPFDATKIEAAIRDRAAAAPPELAIKIEAAYAGSALFDPQNRAGTLNSIVSRLKAKAPTREDYFLIVDILASLTDAAVTVSPSTAGHRTLTLDPNTLIQFINRWPGPLPANALSWRDDSPSKIGPEFDDNDIRRRFSLFISRLQLPDAEVGVVAPALAAAIERDPDLNFFGGVRRDEDEQPDDPTSVRARKSPLLNAAAAVLAGRVGAAPFNASARSALMCVADTPVGRSGLLRDFRRTPSDNRDEYAIQLAAAGVYDADVLAALRGAFRRRFFKADEALRAAGESGLSILDAIARDPTQSPELQEHAVMLLIGSETGATNETGLARIRALSTAAGSAAARGAALAHLEDTPQSTDSDKQYIASRLADLSSSGRVDDVAAFYERRRSSDPILDFDTLDRLARATSQWPAHTLSIAAIRAPAHDQARRDQLLLSELNQLRDEASSYRTSQKLLEELYSLITPSDAPSVDRVKTLVASTDDDDPSFWAAAGRLARDRPDIASAIISRVRQSEFAPAVGALAGLPGAEVSDTLQRAMRSRLDFVRVEAAKAQLAGREPSSRDPVYATLIDASLSDKLEEKLLNRFSELHHWERPRLEAQSSGLAFFMPLIQRVGRVEVYRKPGRSAAGPQFPWPPPAGFQDYEIPANLLPGPTATIQDLQTAISSALDVASGGQYRARYFSGPEDGFILLTNREQIKPTGDPVEGRLRWHKDGDARSLIDTLTDILFGPPGYSRVIAFAVTEHGIPAGGVGQVPDVDAGAAQLDASLLRQKIGPRRVHALVYTFERLPGPRAGIWKVGVPDARAQLLKAGILPNLQVVRTGGTHPLDVSTH